MNNTPPSKSILKRLKRQGLNFFECPDPSGEKCPWPHCPPGCFLRHHPHHLRPDPGQ
jgi:hypothetical protein